MRRCVSRRLSSPWVANQFTCLRVGCERREISVPPSFPVALAFADSSLQPRSVAGPRPRSLALPNTTRDSEHTTDTTRLFRLLAFLNYETRLGLRYTPGAQ